MTFIMSLLICIILLRHFVTEIKTVTIPSNSSMVFHLQLSKVYIRKFCYPTAVTAPYGALNSPSSTLSGISWVVKTDLGDA